MAPARDGASGGTEAARCGRRVRRAVAYGMPQGEHIDGGARLVSTT